MKFTFVEGMDFGNITVYALSTCGWCKKAKKFLNEHNVAYSYIDVDLLPADEVDKVVEEQMKFNPTGSFPTIVIENKPTIIGFNLESLNKLVGIN